jgi:hypothetical protein
MDGRRNVCGCLSCACLGGVLLLTPPAGAAGVPLPPLPETSGQVAIPAQDVAGMTGRTVRV